jgi:hypothetical protein
MPQKNEDCFLCRHSPTRLSATSDESYRINPLIGALPTSSFSIS